MSDAVNHPPHYKGFSNGAEVIDITENLNFNLGNVVKYVARAGRKTDDPVEDLRKAQWYLYRELARINGDEPVRNGHGRRAWNLLDNVPPGVIVKDRYGFLYRRISGTGRFEYRTEESLWQKVEPVYIATATGPFIEEL